MKRFGYNELLLEATVAPVHRLEPASCFVSSCGYPILPEGPGELRQYVVVLICNKTNENHTRQLRISKRLAKAVCLVPIREYHVLNACIPQSKHYPNGIRRQRKLVPVTARHEVHRDIPER